MDEFTVVNKAREFVRLANASHGVPANLDAYLAHVGAKVHLQDDMELEEAGYNFQKPNGTHCICVNGKDDEKRRRFTICHELAHIVLGLTSEHKGPAWSYAKRPQNEVLCDVFAAELLLPYQQFRALAVAADMGFAAIDDLAERFEASTMATTSRFVAVSKEPCAYVMSEKGKVRYATLSPPFRSTGARVIWGDLPTGSLTSRLRGGAANTGAEEVGADLWLEGCDALLVEEARYLKNRDQAITLLWVDDGEELQSVRQDRREREIESYGLAELDGNLPWPGKRRRR